MEHDRDAEEKIWWYELIWLWWGNYVNIIISPDSINMSHYGIRCRR